MDLLAPSWTAKIEKQLNSWKQLSTVNVGLWPFIYIYICIYIYLYISVVWAPSTPLFYFCVYFGILTLPTGWWVDGSNPATAWHISNPANINWQDIYHVLSATKRITKRASSELHSRHLFIGFGHIGHNPPSAKRAKIASWKDGTICRNLVGMSFLGKWVVNMQRSKQHSRNEVVSRGIPL